MAHRELTKSRRRDFAGDEADGGAALGEDGGDAAELPRTNGGDGDVQLVAARRMVVTASTRAPWTGVEARAEPRLLRRARLARFRRLAAGKSETKGHMVAHEDGKDRGEDQGLGGGLTVTESRETRRRRRRVPASSYGGLAASLGLGFGANGRGGRGV